MLSADVTTGRDRNYVGKVVCLGKNFCKMEVTPAGDRMKLTPIELAMGNVKSGNIAYRAILFSSDHGALLISGQKDQKVSVPVGEWSVINYTVDGGPGTTVAATFGMESSSVEVKKSGTASLVFGAPFHAEVTAARIEPNKVHLSLAIVGAGGEHCTSLYVNGKRPQRPRFTIKDEDGKVVQQGSFEYG
jgi:hypothetical protein